MRRLFIVLSAFLIAGCMAMVHGTADQLNKISIGMPKDEVIKVLGPPKSIAANEGIEYMQYRWVKTVIATDANWPDDYFVAIKEGKVSSYGKKGDFDSTKPPTQRIEIDKTVRDVSAQKREKDLYTELKKLKDLKDSGVITEAEFEAQKKKALDSSQ